MSKNAVQPKKNGVPLGKRYFEMILSMVNLRSRERVGQTHANSYLRMIRGEQ